MPLSARGTIAIAREVFGQTGRFGGARLHAERARQFTHQRGRAQRCHFRIERRNLSSTCRRRRLIEIQHRCRSIDARLQHDDRERQDGRGGATRS